MVRMLKLKAVEEFSGKRKTSIYRGVQDGSFPAPVRVGRRAVAWRSDDLERWLAERTAERDAAAEGAA